MPSSTALDPRPAALTVAAVLCFVWAALFALFVLVQMGLGISQDSTKLQLLSIWNALVVIVYVFIGIGILKRHPQGYFWGVGSNTLNLILDVYALFAHDVTVNVMFIPLEIATLVILVKNRSAFPLPAEAKAQASAS